MPPLKKSLLPTQSGSTAYALVRPRRQKGARFAAVPLPFSIGSAGDNDVIVNTAALPPRGRIVQASSDALTLIDALSKSSLEISSLSSLGLDVIGPISGDIADAGSALAKLKVLAARERQWFQSLSPSLRQLLMGRLRQPLRLGAWLAFTAFLATALLIPNKATQTAADRSNEHLHLDWGQVFAYTVNAVSDPAFLKGATFAITVPDSVKTSDSVLRFELAGLDHPGEVVILANGKEIYTAEADSACIDNFCAAQVLLPAGTVEAGELIVKFAHNPADATFSLRRVVAHGIIPFDAETRLVLDQTLQLAARNFEEREIVLQNLLAAQQQIQKVNSLLQTHSGADELRVKIKNLSDQIAAAYGAKIDDLSFKAQREIRLGNFAKAKEHFTALMVFYPDPNSPQRRAITGNLKRLEDLTK